MAYRNPEDRKAAVRRHYEENKESYKARARAHTDKERQKIKSYIASYLAGNPCIDCGEADPIVLEFDHRDVETKKFNIGNESSKGYSLVNTIAEIEKCDVRCANCHRRRTYWQWRQGVFDIKTTKTHTATQSEPQR